MKKRSSKIHFDFPLSLVFILLGVVVSHLSLYLFLQVVQNIFFYIIGNVVILGAAMGSYRKRDNNLFWFLVSAFSWITLILIRALFLTRIVVYYG